jgi:hypothetical protein
MPTARELLEQADALMRRNRGDTGIPVLTDSVRDAARPPARGGPSTRERSAAMARTQGADARVPRGPREDRAEAPAPTQESAPRAATQRPARAPDALAEPAREAGVPDLPLLTDVVDEVAVEIVPLPPPTGAEGEHSIWLGPDTIDPSLHSITGPAPDTVAVVPPVTLRAGAAVKVEASDRVDDRDPTVTRTLRAAGSAATPPPAGSTPPQPPEPAPGAVREPERAAVANDDERWRALAEQISMQVLQRLDLFIDTGLKAQLAAHLQPIVARAGAELVEAINDHVGQLVRTYVAEAIEREIAQWRQQNK